MPELEHLTPAAISPLATQHMVRMRDGVRLATDVYLPDEDAGDTILIRLPYDKNGEYTFISTIAEYFMRRDYRVVAQDVRGKFRSEGEALLAVNEVNDGYDTLEWITQQPWSNARVAMWGDSYYGFTQWAAAASGHPALKAIAPRVTGTHLGEPVIRDTESRVSDVEMGITRMYPLTHFVHGDTYLWEPDWSRRDFAAQAEEFMEQIGTRSLSYDQLVPHPLPLRRFPEGTAFAGRSIPVLHTIGWWDNIAPPAWADVAELASYPSWNAQHYLRIESIDHENHTLLESPEDRVETRTPEQLAAMMPAYLDPALEFFEVFVRGVGVPSDVPRVLWNLAGTEEFRTGEVWPPCGARASRLHAGPDGSLGVDQVHAEGTVSWTHDSLDPVPSSVEDAFSYLREFPDEAPLGERDDVVVFTSQRQTANVELAGPVTATLRFSSTGPVADCFLRLLDVRPDGSALRIARGQIQLRDATQAATVHVDLGQVGYLLRAGHRLRLHVSSTDYPEFLPQPGTGADPWSHGSVTEPNQQTVVLGGGDGLVLEVPVLAGELS
ncbi:CocE/NonD family hydrolase [Galactobacter valiniphilus]|uniref:CocE/NonD family hydrolase n=1 Tax=Galactobacter valiniphilus TaxID=2676122 RepID=UPI003734EAA4